MQLPSDLQQAIDQIVEHTSHASLKKARELLSLDYKQGKTSPFSDEAKSLAYLGARMPATFGAVHKVLMQVPFPIRHLLDLGAGPGTAAWAASEIFPDLQKITLIEQSKEAISLGKRLAQNRPVLQAADWIQGSLPCPIPEADAAIFSYVLNELADPVRTIREVWKKIPLLILVEPGTPKGFQIIREARQMLIDEGAFILAPCTHRLKCPISGSDWCHFAARIERSKLHRMLKEGSLGYEDEKFSYLIASRKEGEKFAGRIIRRPEKGSGFVKLTVCTGGIEKITVTRSQKEIYKRARDAEWGEIW
jgi:ribosomal protein RSM22 (predicted rRNA methylase)